MNTHAKGRLQTPETAVMDAGDGGRPPLIHSLERVEQTDRSNDHGTRHVVRHLGASSPCTLISPDSAHDALLGNWILRRWHFSKAAVSFTYEDEMRRAETGLSLAYVCGRILPSHMWWECEKCKRNKSPSTVTSNRIFWSSIIYTGYAKSGGSNWSRF